MVADREVGVDELVNNLTTPSQKRSYLDYFNIAYRGFVPGGLNRKDDAESAPALPDGGSDAATFDETEQVVADLPVEPEPIVQAVVIVDDLSRVVGKVEKYFNSYQVNAPVVGATVLTNRDDRRSRVLLRFDSSTAADRVYIGENESVGTTGFAMLPGVQYELFVTRQIWAAVSAANPQTVFVLVEYDKEI